MADDPQRTFLRHTLATLAYRGGKAVRGAPADYASFRSGDSSRTPGQILAHISDLLDWALSLARGKQVWHDSPALSWEDGQNRFFAALAAFDVYLASDLPLQTPVEGLFQGPVADALTHVGQIAFLRRQAGLPVRGENYYLAEVSAGRVGPEQPRPIREFD
jgi:hypothetical protein